jgi:hypothetical protein
MAFTYDPALSTNVSLVRFHIGDTNENGAFLADETINYLVTTYSVGEAVVRSIQYIITQLSQPDFRLDWMQVSNKEARAGYEKLLKEKAQEFGIRLSKLTPTSTISQPYRADSYQDSDDAVYDGAPA